jgi:hypothetical protein
MAADTLHGIASGRATDAQVARLLGWTHIGKWHGDEPIGRDEWVGVPPNGIEEFHRGERDRAVAWLPPFSSDPAAATSLQRDALRRFGLQCKVAHDAEHDAERCVLDGADGRHVEVSAPSGQTALAICVAIITALGALLG